MINPKFLWRKFRETDTSRIKAAAKRVASKTGRLYPAVYLDILKCILKYGTGYVDYETYEMYDMTPEERAGFLTIGKNNDLVRKLNDPAYRKFFEDKALFNEKFSEFIKRDWLLMDGDNRDAFKALLEDKGALLVKPLDQSCGNGIEKVIYDDSIDSDALYDHLYVTERVLAEEIVKQCDEMNVLCETSVNTIRLITIYNSDDDISVAAGAIRMGRAGSYVDNFNHGGLAVIIDASTGVSVTDGYDKSGITYKEVPGSGIALKGFKVPMWDECKALVKEAAKVVPQVRYVAWDVAISRDNGPLLIEGNSYPGQDVTQFPKLNLGTYAALSKLIK